jgi:rod shape-determining protein MreB
MAWISSFSNDLAIDLGTANTSVFARGRGIILSEPSVIALNSQTLAVEAVGSRARDMLGRTPDNISAIRPMRDGVVADYEAAEKMIGAFIRQSQGWLDWRRRRVVVGVPADSSTVEKRAIQDTVSRARVHEVYLVEESMAAAVGAGLPVDEATGSMIVDIGAGTTDVAVISLGGIVQSKSVRVAGNHMDQAIVQYLRRRHGLAIGEHTAEQIKIQIGSGDPLDESLTMDVRGHDSSENRSRVVVLTDSDIREALAEPVRQIVQAVLAVLDRVPPELSADLYDRGIVLTGGGSLLRNLDRRISRETALPVIQVAEPLSSVALGAGKMLADAELLRRASTDLH